jgi:tetrahydromethanopterin S-methyltransferase subunit G
MATIAFDTLRFSKRLKDAGVPDKQAEAEAEALAEVFEVNLKELATKDDILLVRKDLDALERRIEDRMTMLEQRMTIKLGGLMVIAVGTVATLVKLL